MSKVQCLRGLEPRDLTPRRSPLPVKRSVCRNLFGFVDHEALQKDMTQRLREICARDRDRWNFNFELSSPQDGVYEWRRVSAHDLPEFYRDSVHSGRTRVPAGPRSPVSQTPVSLSPVSQTPVCLSPVSQTPVSRRRTHAPRTAGENQRVTDFFVKRKKVVDRTDVKSAIRPEHTEKTPRKKLR
ncbi:unnamed protein product [Knipowitschia caucasica]|uniref:Cyclin-dependent kinase inhibitor domain-containing protein n=1 Tax=Knipowitschia caucasica TaxID=637954 RepID=A0AAV2L5C2_KNICA